MMMLLAAAALAAAAPACPSGDDSAAHLCRALEASDGKKFTDAAGHFEAAATGSTANDPRTARLLAAAGNMWLAAGQPGRAAVALDRALAGTGLQAEQRGLAQLDRARTAEAQNDLKTARRMVTEAGSTIAEDPFLWYFSAALAIREGDLATAKSAINKSLSLAPDAPEILFEAGHVAQASGDAAGARTYWNQTLAADPEGPTGKAAKAALAMLSAPQPMTTPPAR